jgi:hypothetical protein
MDTPGSPAVGGEAATPRSPTLPLPPPGATQIPFEEFIEAATRAVMRAVQSVELNPQPEPPGVAAAAVRRPELVRPPIIVGIVFNPPLEELGQPEV